MWAAKHCSILFATILQEVVRFLLCIVEAQNKNVNRFWSSLHFLFLVITVLSGNSNFLTMFYDLFYIYITISSGLYGPPMKLDTCALAGKRCHCEENRYEMYTYCKRSCGYCGQERLRKYDDCKRNSGCISCASGGIQLSVY